MYPKQKTRIHVREKAENDMPTRITSVSRVLYAVVGDILKVYLKTIGPYFP